jgi:predicted ATPase
VGMKIKRLYINNYKSLVNFELLEPNPFSVFVGPNAAGKSNVFEALEFLSYWVSFPASTASTLFNGPENFVYLGCKEIKELQTRLVFNLFIDNSRVSQAIALSVKDKKLSISFYGRDLVIAGRSIEEKNKIENDLINAEKKFVHAFSRLFIQNKNLRRLNTNSSEKLNIDAGNLPAVLKSVFDSPTKKTEILEWLQILIPEFEDILVSRDDISGIDTVLVKEKSWQQYLKRDLLSDGTYNILALLTAVYQSDEPQFLCIEEPENGLNPYVVRTLVGFFRQMCEEKGHYIWLNTHSATLVRELRNEEIILVDKVDGITKAKQIPHDFKRYDLEMDEAWLTNALGGGLPW